MTFLAVLIALLIEQFKPLPRGNVVHEASSAWMRWAGINFNAGRDRHAWVVSGITTLAPALLAWGAWVLLAQASLLLALAYSVAVLYLTLGFRQFSHYFTDIRDALERGDEPQARRLLAQWRLVATEDLDRRELLRLVIEQSLLAAHRHVFGVFFWYVVLATLGLGPAGAVLYRLSGFAARYWTLRAQADGLPPNDHLSALARRQFALLDHVPARLTAFGFAVVGNFEEAVNGWRRDSALWPAPNEGVLLAAAAGAMGVQLGGRRVPPRAAPATRSFEDSAFPELDEVEGATPGAPPSLGHLRSVVGLVWRSVVLWMLLLALLSVANLVG